MSTPPEEKPFPLIPVTMVVAAVAVISLGIILVVLATISDTVPSYLTPATQNAPGN
jgi:hypothetical protein